MLKVVTTAGVVPLRQALTLSARFGRLAPYVWRIAQGLGDAQAMQRGERLPALGLMPEGARDYLLSMAARAIGDIDPTGRRGEIEAAVAEIARWAAAKADPVAPDMVAREAIACYEALRSRTDVPGS